MYQPADLTKRPQLLWNPAGAKCICSIAKCICLNCQMYLSQLWNVFYKLRNMLVQIAKCGCPNCEMYLSKLRNVFVKIAKCICLNCKMYLSRLWNIFVQIEKCICPKTGPASSWPDKEASAVVEPGRCCNSAVRGSIVQSVRGFVVRAVWDP